MRNILYFLLLILLVACNQPAPRNNEITKIEFARMWDWERSEKSAAISIDSSLTYNYAVFDTTKEEYYSGKITQAYWDTINTKIEHINYKKFKTFTPGFDGTIIECCAYEMIITYKGGKKRIRKFRDEKDSVVKVFDWINSSYKNIKLNRVNSLILFETTFQHPPSTEAPPYEGIKFPSPNKN